MIANQAQLLECFRAIDRPDVDGAVFPMQAEAVTTWTFGARAFLLLRDGKRCMGMVFHRDNAALPAVATMCQWCHSVRGRGGVKLLSVRATDKRWVGQYLCADLDCLRAEPGVDDLRESLDDDARNARTVERVKLFASRCVF